MSNRNIYQYMDAAVSVEPEDDENTRWIAAASLEEADRAAAERGWVSCGGLIYKAAYVEQDQLEHFGCDLVV